MSDLAIYAAHAAFWGAFGITRLFAGRRGGPASVSGPAAAAESQRAQAAPFSRSLLAFHMLAFGVMYFGVGDAVFGRGAPELFPLQRAAGSLAMAAGAGLMCWSLLYFRSWRFRAKIDAGHELATGGPFAWVRHPIYAGLNLLALGTALWIPTVTELVALLLMALAGDLRARAEEKLLLGVFGDAYRGYRARTRRFVPGIY